MIGLAVIILLLYVMARRRLLEKLKSIQFFQSILGEFNEENIGNNLVLEIVDYKKKRKSERERELNQTENSLAHLDQSTSNDASLQA